MKKNVKKNIVMILSLSVAGVVALALLVYAVILFFDWSGYRSRTDKAREKIESLRKQKPAPGAENEERIKKDIALYEEKGRGLIDNFKSPLRPAADAFLKELPPPLASALSDEEKEMYKVPGTGEEGDEETPAVPLKIRQLTFDELKAFFAARFEKFCNDKEITEEDERMSMTTLNRFRAECVQIFPRGSWNQALEKFVATASPLIYEPIHQANELSLLLYAFGSPRRVDKDRSSLQHQLDELISQKIIPMAKNSNLKFANGAFDFIGTRYSRSYGEDGENSTNTSSRTGEMSTLNPQQFGFAFFHWDVFGDIVHRLCGAKASSLEKVILRTAAAEEGGDGMYGGGGSQLNTMNLAESFEQIGNYKLYHYTIVFTGTMSSIREALRRFDRAWMDRRMYVVRGVALYAADNGAGKIMGQITEQDGQNRMSTDDTPRRRRRGRRIRDFESDSEFSGDGNQNMTEEEIQRHLAEQEAKLPPHERTGYGDVLIGKARECKVYLDVDYVVLEQNQ